MCLFKKKKKALIRAQSLPFMSLLSVPAGDSMARDYFALASIHAVVWLQKTGALARQSIKGAVTGIAQTLGFVGPTVHHAARKLIAGQEFTGICLVSWSPWNTETAGIEEKGERQSGGVEKSLLILMKTLTVCRFRKEAWRTFWLMLSGSVFFT